MLESGYSAHDATPFSRVEELVVASNQAQAEKTAGLMELIVVGQFLSLFYTRIDLFPAVGLCPCYDSSPPSQQGLINNSSHSTLTKDASG